MERGVGDVRVRRLGRLVACTALVGASTVLGSSAASATEGSDAEDRIARYDLAVRLDDHGVADVRLDLDVDFGSEPNHGPYLTYLVKEAYEGRDADPERPQDRVYRISDLEATGPGDSTAPVETEEEGQLLVVRIGDEDVEVTGLQHYTVTFRVEGWVNAADWTGNADDELYLDVLSGWAVPVDDVTVTVTGPAQATAEGCTVGGAGSTTPCDDATTDGGAAVFRHAAVDRGDLLTVTATFPAGTFDAPPVLQDRWTVSRAFDVTPATGAVAALVALVGGGLLLRRTRQVGDDEQYLGLTPGLTPPTGEEAAVGRRERTPVTVQFAPPVGFRAGQLGTLVDERSDDQDVTATLIDLAVRGHLRIEQVAGADDDRDWRLVRLRRAPHADLLPYERLLLDEVFADRHEVTLSALRTTFSDSMSKVRSALYTDVTERGWFRGNPQHVRNAWAVASVFLILGALTVTAVLALWTTWGLVGVPLVLLGVVALALTGRAPARTPTGTAVLVQAEGFRRYLATAEASQLRFEEGEDLFSRYLPYAVAFGLTERWARMFAELAAQGRAVAEPTWYVGPGYGPAMFWAGAGSFGHDLSAFAAQAGQAFSAPSPGSSGGSGGGGGFAGGGVGGGGGGTW